MEENLPPVPENNTTKPNATPEKAPVAKKKLKPGQIVIIVLAALLVLVPLIVYFFMDMEVSKLETRQKMETDSLRSATALQIKQINEDNLKTVAKVFSWAVRAEMMRENMEQVDQIMTELVKVNDFRQVVLLSSSGEVLLSTDKKFEGKAYSESFYQQIAGSDQVQLSVQKNGDLLVSAPVFGIDARLGSVVITYTPAATAVSVPSTNP
jgi:L-lactate utilization protein LutC